jgi:hypothetical protein
MLTDEQLTEIWRRLQVRTPGKWDTHDTPPSIIASNGGVVCYDAFPADADFIANAPADIEALLIEVKRLREIITDHIAQPKPVSEAGKAWGSQRAQELRTLVDEIAREYNYPLEDQLDSTGEDT